MTCIDDGISLPVSRSVAAGSGAAGSGAGRAISDRGFDAIFEPKLAMPRLQNLLPTGLSLEHRPHQHFLVGLEWKISETELFAARVNQLNL